MNVSNVLTLPHFAKVLRESVKPNGKLSHSERRAVGAVLALLLLALWTFVHIPFFPGPGKCWAALQHLWLVDGLGLELFTSVKLYYQSMVVGVVIAGVLALATVFPLMRIPVTWLTYLRFLSMAGVNLFAIILLGSGYWLMFTLMAFYQTITFLKPLVDTIERIDKGKYAHARTIYKSEWKVVYEVIILGRAADFLKDIQTNQYMGWTMLFIIESISLSEGGIGSLMVRLMKNPDLAKVAVMMALCIVAGILLDKLPGWARKRLCPAADLKTERS